MTVRIETRVARTSRRQIRQPLIRRIPVIGGIARELAEGDGDYPFYLMLALVTGWASAVLVWGLPALYLPALALAPVVMLTLLAITRG